MKVADLLKSKGEEVVTIARDASVRDAVEMLRKKKIGALVVSSDGRRIDGIVSERDIVHGLARHGTGLLDRKVSDAMTTAVMTCSPDEGVRHVMWVMTEHRNRHVPVLDAGTLCGIISIGDVVKSRLDELEMETTVLRDAYIARR
jgi:CBS domain-containing protein